MGIQFEDGSFINANDWQQIKRILAEKGRQNGTTPRVTEIRSRDGVTVKVGNLELKKKPLMPLSQPNYISGEYEGWTIRVWRQDREEIYGCNYFRGEDIRYLEVSYGDALDENGVFKVAKDCINEVNNE